MRLRFHPLQMGEMAHGRLAFSWPACTGCLPMSESIEISSPAHMRIARRCHDALTQPAAAGCCTSTGPEAVSRIPPVARIRRYMRGRPWVVSGGNQCHSVYAL